MPSGTGINKLIDKYPDRFLGWQIAEQHAITSMAAMAKERDLNLILLFILLFTKRIWQNNSWCLFNEFTSCFCNG